MDMNERIRRAAGKIPPEEAPAPPPRHSGEGSADGGAASPSEPEPLGAREPERLAAARFGEAKSPKRRAVDGVGGGP
jgi:hypothetical protein